jgi:7-cyano-7-deazaguanosine (preQ0) biosynthesis protein QueE
VSNTLVVSEVFGPTYQGEGPHTGQRVAFVRTGGCNLHCDWCDTPYTWDASRYDLRAELSRKPVADIVDTVLDMEPQRIVVSGGEPLLHQQQAGWIEMLEGFAWAAVPVEVETNGTLAPNDRTRLLVDSFNVSPKLAHAGDPATDRLREGPLRAFAGLARAEAAVMKVVVQQASDVTDARDVAQQVGFPLDRVWVMPEGTTAHQLLARHREIADAALACGLNFTTRLHVLTWGEERAR